MLLARINHVRARRPVFLGEVSLCLLLVIVWRSSVAFSLPGLAAVGTNTLSTQAASKHVTYYCLVVVIDIFAGLALLPALLLIPSPSSAFSFGVLCRILSITLSTFGLLVSVKLLHRATSETDAPLVTVVPGVLLAVFSFGRLPVGTLPSFASSSGSIMENGVLVPRAAASSRLQSAGRVLGEGRRLGSG